MAMINLGGMNFFMDDSKTDSRDGQKMIEYFAQNWHWIVWVLAALLVFWIIFLILGIISRGALIISAHKLSKGELVGFKAGVKKGRKYFWKIFLISASLKLAAFFLILATCLPVALLFMSHRPITGFFMAVLATLITIPLIVLFFFMRIFGQLYAILGNLNFWPALENGYNLFRKNISASLIMGLIFILLNIFLCILILMAAIPVAIIFLLIGLIVFLVAGKIGVLIVGAIGVIIFIIFALIVKSAYEVFAQSAWVFFFQEIATPKIEEKIVEIEKETVELPKALPVVECKKE